MTEEVKDIIVSAFPKNDNATIEGGSADGMIFLNKKYGSTKKQTIPSKEVNAFLKELNTHSLHYSFKAGKEEDTILVTPLTSAENIEVHLEV